MFALCLFSALSIRSLSWNLLAIYSTVSIVIIYFTVCKQIRRFDQRIFNFPLSDFPFFCIPNAKFSVRRTLYAVIVCLLTNFVNMNNYPRQHWYYAPRNVYNSTDTYVTKSHISSIKLNFQWKILLVKHFWKTHFTFQTEPNQESKQTRIKYLK